MNQLTMQQFICAGCQNLYCIGREPMQISLNTNICSVCLTGAQEDSKDKKFKVVTIGNKDFRFLPSDPVPNQALKSAALQFYDSPATMKELEFVYNKQFLSATGYMAVPNDKKDFVIKYENGDLRGDASKLKQLVKQINAKTQQYLTILEKIENIEQKDCSVISAQFNEIINFCLVAPYTFPKVVEGLKYPYLEEDGDIKDSVIVKPIEWNLIKGWLPVQNPQLKLLFRAQKDGFENFHEKCDNQGRTVVIAKAKEHIFGGYAAIPWHSTDEYSADPTNQTFIFSVNNQSKHNLLPSQQKYDIFGSAAYGPTFGGGHDLKIGQEHSHSNIGFSYEAPKDIPQGTQDSRKYIGGEDYFTVDDYQVYLVN